MATKLTTETAVVDALRQRFAPPAWVVLTGVANGTGVHASRYADALAMSVWPSRGLELHGFEVKTSRSDFLRELKKPDKAESIAAYCDRWWIAAGSKDVAAPEDLPPAWGLLVPHGKTMKIVKDASKTSAKKLTRVFLAAVLRRVSEQHDASRIRDMLRAEVQAEVRREATEAAKTRYEFENEALRQHLAESRAQVTKLQDQIAIASDLRLSPGLIGRGISLLKALSGYRGSRQRLSYMIQSIEEHQESLTQTKDAVDEIKSLLDELYPE